MKLDAWMRAKKVPNHTLAAEIGVHPISVSKYRSGKMIPRWPVMDRIVTRTSGLVQPGDFYSAVPASKSRAREAQPNPAEAVIAGPVRAVLDVSSSNSAASVNVDAAIFWEDVRARLRVAIKDAGGVHAWLVNEGVQIDRAYSFLTRKCHTSPIIAAALGLFVPAEFMSRRSAGLQPDASASRRTVGRVYLPPAVEPAPLPIKTRRASEWEGDGFSMLRRAVKNDRRR